MVEDFHLRYRHTIGTTPKIRDADLRVLLLQEECEETIKAIREGDLVEAVDGLVDLIYVAIGTAVACGVNLEPLFAEVHASNMSKDGPVDRRGKVTKGDGFRAPRIAGGLLEQGWGGEEEK